MSTRPRTMVMVAVGGALVIGIATVTPRVVRLVEGVRVDLEGMRAPGTDALRAAGCIAPVVADLRKQVTAKLDAPSRELVAAGKVPVPAEIDRPFVMCMVDADTSLTCERVADVYAHAVTPIPETVSVLMKRRYGDETECSGVFARDGRRVGDFPFLRSQ